MSPRHCPAPVRISASARPIPVHFGLASATITVPKTSLAEVVRVLRAAQLEDVDPTFPHVSIVAPVGHQLFPGTSRLVTPHSSFASGSPGDSCSLFLLHLFSFKGLGLLPSSPSMCSL